MPLVTPLTLESFTGAVAVVSGSTAIAVSAGVTISVSVVASLSLHEWSDATDTMNIAARLMRIDFFMLFVFVLQTYLAWKRQCYRISM